MSKPVLSLGFDVPFTEAIAWAKNRVSVLPDTYYNDLPSQARSRAFTVSGLSALDQIQGVLDSLHRATESGETFAQWKKTLKPEVLALGNARLDNIFRTGIQTHYNIGRYEQQEANKAHRPYRMWDAINDGRTRPAHKAMDNFIAPIDDPIWRKWSAPAGFRCRCSTISLTEAQAKQRGYKVGNQPPVGAEPDKGWDYDKRTGHDANLEQIKAQRLAKVDADIRAAAEKAWCKGEARKFAESLLVPDNGGMKKADAIINELASRAKGDTQAEMLSSVWISSESLDKHVKKRVRERVINDIDDYAKSTFEVLALSTNMIIVEPISNDMLLTAKIQLSHDGWIVLLNEFGQIITSHPFVQGREIFEDRHRKLGDKVYEQEISSYYRSILAQLFGLR